MWYLIKWLKYELFYVQITSFKSTNLWYIIYCTKDRNFRHLIFWNINNFFICQLRIVYVKKIIKIIMLVAWRLMKFFRAYQLLNSVELKSCFNKFRLFRWSKIYFKSQYLLMLWLKTKKKSVRTFFK